MKAVFLWGSTGSGKTLRAVMLALVDCLLGRQIYGNLHLKGIPYTYVEIPDLIDMVLHKKIDSSPKTLILDEIQTAFDGRRSGSNQNIALSLFVSQCRKRGFNIIYTSQFITGADSRMRTLTDKLTRCVAEKTINDVGLGDIHNPEPTKLKYMTIRLDNPNKVYTKTIPRAIARHFYQFYNTYEVIRPRESYLGGETI